MSEEGQIGIMSGIRLDEGQQPGLVAGKGQMNTTAPSAPEQSQDDAGATPEQSQDQLLLAEVKNDIIKHLQAIADRAWCNPFGSELLLSSKEEEKLVQMQWHILIGEYLQGFTCRKYVSNWIHYAWSGNVALIQNAFCKERFTMIEREVAKRALQAQYFESEAKRQKQLAIENAADAFMMEIGKLDALGFKRTFTTTVPPTGMIASVKERYPQLVDIVPLGLKQAAEMNRNLSFYKASAGGVRFDDWYKVTYQVTWRGKERIDVVDSKNYRRHICWHFWCAPSEQAD